MAITLKNIAVELGLSTTLVSQVLNGKAAEHRIKKETELLVISKAQELGYVPNQIARGLRLKRSKNIALVTSDLANPFFASITKTIQNELREKGYNLMIFGTNDDTEREKEEISLLKSRGIDGLIIIPVGHEYKHLEKLLSRKFPFVILYRTFKEFQANSVTVDNFSSAYDAVNLILKNGHTKIGMIQGKSNIFTNSERLRGYKTALREHNIKFNPNYIIGENFTRESGYLGANKLLEMKSAPTALITTSELITLGALHSITEHKLKIPDDICLVAFDSIDIAHSLMVPISSINPPKKLLGEIAVKMVIDEIEGGKNQKTKVALQSHFEISESMRAVSERYEISHN